MQHRPPSHNRPLLRAAEPCPPAGNQPIPGTTYYLSSHLFPEMAAFFYFSPTIEIPMKRFFLALLVVFLLAIAFVAWRILGPGTAFSGDTYALYIRTGMTYDQLQNLLIKDTVIESPAFFDWVAARMDYPANIKAGKYEIRKDMSILKILRLLHNGHQS